MWSRRENPRSTTTEDGSATTAASKTRARVSHFPTCNVQEQEDFEKTAFWRSHGTQHFKKLRLKMHFVLQPSYVMGRVECKLAPQAHGTLLFYLTMSFFLTPRWVLRAPSVKWWVTTCSKVRSYANCSHVHFEFFLQSQVLTIFCTQNLKMACIKLTHAF